MSIGKAHKDYVTKRSSNRTKSIPKKAYHYFTASILNHSVKMSIIIKIAWIVGITNKVTVLN